MASIPPSPCLREECGCSACAFSRICGPALYGRFPASPGTLHWEGFQRSPPASGWFLLSPFNPFLTRRSADREAPAFEVGFLEQTLVLVRHQVSLHLRHE